MRLSSSLALWIDWWGLPPPRGAKVLGCPCPPKIDTRPEKASAQMFPQPLLQSFWRVWVYLILAGVSSAPPLPALAEAPCDSVQASELAEEEPPVQIGVRSELGHGACTYVYTVLNRSRDVLTAVQVGYAIDGNTGELTGARPHAPPDTVNSPRGWECVPLLDKDASTFALGWRVAPGFGEGWGIPPDTLMSGFTVTLPRPDPLYEHCHWLVRLKGERRGGYAGWLRAEGELGAISRGTGTISGKVTDARGTAVPYPDIFVRGAMLPSVSRADGTYLISQVPAGSVFLVARSTGYEPCQKARIRVAANDTTRIDFLLHAAGTSTPCAPYVTALDRLKIPFPGGSVDTAGARFLDRRTRIPSGKPGETSVPHAYIYSLASRDVEVVFRGLGQDTIARAFVANIHRNFQSSEQERLIRIAEETYPPSDAILSIAGTRPGKAALSKEAHLWWYDEFDGVRLPYAVTLDAVRYYLGLVQGMGRGDSTQTHGIRMKRCEFSYYVNISPRRETFSRDGRVFQDVFVVEMGLSWSNYCSPLCACFFKLDRTVILRPDGGVLCVFGDRKPSVMVS